MEPGANAFSHYIFKPSDFKKAKRARRRKLSSRKRDEKDFRMRKFNTEEMKLWRT